MNHISYATKWHLPATVDIYWSIDDDDLAIQVLFQGKDITAFLTAAQMREIDAICRKEAYERNHHA